MSTRKSWAPGWKTIQPPRRETHKDASCAEFEDATGNTARVRITPQELKTFGDAPEELQAKGQHTEQVMRAVLERYVKEYGIPQGDIEPSDLGPHLAPLRQEFRKNV